MTTSIEDVELVRESALFDEAYYRSLCTESMDDAAAHYLHDGWRANLDPGPRFSNRHYLAHHADVRDSGNNPLLHYLKYGAKEGRQIVVPSLLVEGPSCPTDDEWDSLLEQWVGVEPAAVDIVVPVYKGKAETLRCIYTVLRSRQQTPFRLVVLDDCGPEPKLRLALERLASRDVIELHRSARNLGFVQTCNVGMSLHPTRDVVLLNSDTAVYNDWLDRLRAAAYRTARTATVTPFSNNAEICSYPLMCEDNILALELSDEELDRLAATCNAEAEVELPTGVGCCMYVRRACLDEIGMFDLEAFGRGYGEENDLCRRAGRAGWRNILAPDVFVRHYGGVSFGAEKLQRVANAVKQVEERNPGYLDEVRTFCEQDPVAPWRRSLDLARLARVAADGAVLFVTHTWGGGTERHVADLEQILHAAGHNTFRCSVSKLVPDRLAITHETVTHIPNLLGFDMATEPTLCARTITAINVKHVHFHHFAGMPAKCVEFFRNVCRKAALSYDVTLHDYMTICPRIFLIDRHGVYCGEPSEEDCDACIQRDGSPFGKPRLWEWREMFWGFLGGARRIFVPDPDVARRLHRYFPDLAFDVRPHPEPSGREPLVGDRSCPRRTNARTIAIVGAIGPNKGFDLVLKCARLAMETALELRFVIVGYTSCDEEFAGLRNTRILGRYEEADLRDILAREDPDICWFPSVWPETYCYTLSGALQAGIFPVAFDLGAPARRIREAGWGHLMPMAAMLDPDEIIACLCTVAIPPRPSRLVSSVTYQDPLISYYAFEGPPLPRRHPVRDDGIAIHHDASNVERRTIAAE